MAITVISVPDDMSIAYRPIVYRWSSDATDLQYCIVELLNSGTRIAAKSVQIDLGTTDEFTVNVADIIEDNIGFELSTLGSTGVITADTSKGLMEAISLKVYEVVESGGLIVTDYDPDDDNNPDYDFWIGGPTDSINLFNAYNWTESHVSYNGFDITDYRLLDVNSKFLNQAPLSKDIELGVSEYLGLLYGQNAPLIFDYKLEVLTYDSTGALLNTDYINITEWNNNYNQFYNDNTYLSVGIGTENLINEGISLTNVAYYTIQLKEDVNTASELRRFNISHVCSGDVRVHWLNKFGKQDSYTFKGNKIHSLEHKSQTYLKALGDTYASENRGRTVTQNISTDNFAIYTKSIGQEDYNFLASMLVNKTAWIEESGSYYPIIIEDGSKLIRNEENVPIQFNLGDSFANSTKGLRG